MKETLNNTIGSSEMNQITNNYDANMIYWKYLKYLLRHKYYVLIECWKLGILWRGIVHDLSKFSPKEFIPYARFFYGDYPKESETRGDIYGIALTQESVKEDFDVAWNGHQKRNKHHWQYWLLKNDDGSEYPLPIPVEYLKEMLADWRGAGMAIAGKDNTREWYAKNKQKIVLIDCDRAYIERKI